MTEIKRLNRCLQCGTRLTVGTLTTTTYCSLKCQRKARGQV
jgi:hypothetical protein